MGDLKSGDLGSGDLDFGDLDSGDLEGDFEVVTGVLFPEVSSSDVVNPSSGSSAMSDSSEGPMSESSSGYPEWLL